VEGGSLRFIILQGTVAPSEHREEQQTDARTREMRLVTDRLEPPEDRRRSRAGSDPALPHDHAPGSDD